MAVRGDSGLWTLTLACMHCVSTTRGLHTPSLVFAVRPLPLADLTSYELVATMKTDGWAWKQRLPPSSAAKKEKDLMPIGYVHGEAKLWFSTPSQVSRTYLLCLCNAEAGSLLDIISFCDQMVFAVKNGRLAENHLLS